jgi:hypothetical protein
MVVSTGLSLTASAAPAVTFTAAAIKTACTTSDTTDCPSDFLAFGLDSIRFSNTQLPPGEDHRAREASTRPIALPLPEDDNLVTERLGMPAAWPIQPTRVPYSSPNAAR